MGSDEEEDWADFSGFRVSLSTETLPSLQVEEDDFGDFLGAQQPAVSKDRGDSFVSFFDSNKKDEETETEEFDPFGNFASAPATRESRSLSAHTFGNFSSAPPTTPTKPGKNTVPETPKKKQPPRTQKPSKSSTSTTDDDFGSFVSPTKQNTPAKKYSKAAEPEDEFGNFVSPTKQNTASVVASKTTNAGSQTKTQTNPEKITSHTSKTPTTGTPDSPETEKQQFVFTEPPVVVDEALSDLVSSTTLDNITVSHATTSSKHTLPASPLTSRSLLLGVYDLEVEKRRMEQLKAQSEHPKEMNDKLVAMNEEYKKQIDIKTKELLQCEEKIKQLVAKASVNTNNQDEEIKELRLQVQKQNEDFKTEISQLKSQASQGFTIMAQGFVEMQQKHFANQWELYNKYQKLSVSDLEQTQDCLNEEIAEIRTSTKKIIEDQTKSYTTFYEELLEQQQINFGECLSDLKEQRERSFETITREKEIIVQFVENAKISISSLIDSLENATSDLLKQNEILFTKTLDECVSSALTRLGKQAAENNTNTKEMMEKLIEEIKHTLSQLTEEITTAMQTNKKQQLEDSKEKLKNARLLLETVQSQLLSMYEQTA